MKRKTSLLWAVIVALVVSVSLESCSSDDSANLSKGTVEDAVSSLLEDGGLEKSYCKIAEGYYEINSENARVALAKLAAAGVITYKVERFAWWNKCLQTGSYFGYYYGNKSYIYEEHFMVDVALTDEGKKYVVDSIPMPEIKEDKDMKQPELDANLPENNYEKENWPKIPNPEAAEEETNEVAEKVKEAVEDAYTSNVTSLFEELEEDKTRNNANEAYMPMDINAKLKYEAAKKKENVNMLIMESSRIDVDKVRYIQTYINPETGISEARAEVIVEMKDVTVAGRVLDGKAEGTKLCTEVHFVYYNDKGWVLQDKHLDFKATSALGAASLNNKVSASGRDTSVMEANRQEAEDGFDEY